MTGRCEISFQFWPPKDSINHLTRKDQNMICRLWKQHIADTWTDSNHSSGQSVCSVYILTRLPYTRISVLYISLRGYHTPALWAIKRRLLLSKQIQGARYLEHKRETLACITEWDWDTFRHHWVSNIKMPRSACWCFQQVTTLTHSLPRYLSHLPHSVTATIFQPSSHHCRHCIIITTINNCSNNKEKPTSTRHRLQYVSEEITEHVIQKG